MWKLNTGYRTLCLDCNNEVATWEALTIFAPPDIDKVDIDGRRLLCEACAIRYAYEWDTWTPLLDPLSGIVGIVAVNKHWKRIEK
jgi:hypothetical protein